MDQTLRIYWKLYSKIFSSDSPDPEMHEYFKHFFTENDLTELFDERYFERMIFSSTVQNIRSKFIREMEEKWTENVLDEYQIFNPLERQEHAGENNKEIKDGYLQCVYRRK